MNEDFFDNLRQTITGTAEAVGKKTEDIVEIQKLRSRIRNAQRNVEVDYKKLGETIYQRYVSGEVLDEELEQVCDLIMDLQKEIAAFKEELANRRGQIVCTACGSGNPRDAVFCMHCGAVIPKAEPETEDIYAAGPVQEESCAEQEVWDACTEETDEKDTAATETVEETGNEEAPENVEVPENEETPENEEAPEAAETADDTEEKAE